MFKIFIYENGAKNLDKEYTDYLIAPLPFGERLDETLDKMCLTLDSMPIESRHTFPPSTKLVAERWLNNTTQIEEDTFYMVVEHDDVQEYIGDTEICTHKIYFNEASAIAQGFIFDDISLTYELNDVTLDYKVSYSDARLNPFDPIEAGVGADRMNKVERHVEGTVTGASYKPDPIYMDRTYAITIEDTESLANIKFYNDNSTTQTVKFNVPRMWFNGVNATGEGWMHLFETRVWCKIMRQALKDDGTIDETSPQERIAYRELGPTPFEDKSYKDAAGNPFYWTSPTQAGIYRILNTEIEDAKYVPAQFFSRTGYPDDSVYKNTYIKRTIVYNCDAAWANREISFEHKQGDRYKYTVELSFGDGGGCVTRYKAYSERRETGFIFTQYHTSFKTVITEFGNPKASTEFCYSNYSGKSQPLLYQPRKYNALDMIKKMILSSDTYFKQDGVAVLDTPAAFYVEGDNIDRKKLSSWASTLAGTQINETVFTGMNLWQGFLEIGKYISAIPYIEFGIDDRLVVKFKQLGVGEASYKAGQKISIFNSRNIADYHSSYVSYVQNLFNPENEVEEWLPVTSDSDDFLIYNNVAKFKTTKPILQINYAALIYNGVEYNGLHGTDNSLFRLFEKNVYNIFFSDWHISPSKGNTYFYTLGTCDIMGLTYIPPQNKNDVEDKIVQPMSLTKIIRELSDTDADIQFNNVFLHIKYKTQDSVRCHIVRPDIGDFVKNTMHESYPHHDQFYGQQDKVIDSERYAQKLYGQLIRDGNWVYENTEYVIFGEEKKTGELYMIETFKGSSIFEPYYVSAVDTEYYDDFSNQKITYSKDFNRMSEICSPPSEVRVYPIANQNLIRREVFDEEFVTVTKANINGSPPKYLSDTWGTCFKAWIFGDGNKEYPNFINITFKADPDTKHLSSNHGEQPIDQLFPTGIVFDSNNESHLTSSDRVDCTVPLLHYPLFNSILFECDMEDNFQVKEYIDTTINNTNADTTVGAYYGRQPYRYCDIFGRADMLSYDLGYKNSFSVDEIRSMPKQQTLADIVASVKDRVLIKDNREELSCNFQINLLHKDSDIILCKGIWWKKKNRVRLCAVASKGNKFENSILQSGVIIADNLDYAIATTSNKMVLSAKFAGKNNDNSETYTLSQNQLVQIQSLVWYDYDQQIPYIIMNTVVKSGSTEFEKLYFVGGIK